MARPKKAEVLDTRIGGLRFAHCKILEDGRVEASLTDHPERPVKEVIGRTTQAEAARFIMNDVCPEAMAAVSDDDDDLEDDPDA